MGHLEEGEENIQLLSKLPLFLQHLWNVLIKWSFIFKDMELFDIVVSTMPNMHLESHTPVQISLLSNHRIVGYVLINISLITVRDLC